MKKPESEKFMQKKAITATATTEKFKIDKDRLYILKLRSKLFPNSVPLLEGRR